MYILSVRKKNVPFVNVYSVFTAQISATPDFTGVSNLNFTPDLLEFLL